MHAKTVAALVTFFGLAAASPVQLQDRALPSKPPHSSLTLSLPPKPTWSPPPKPTFSVPHPSHSHVERDVQASSVPPKPTFTTHPIPTFSIPTHS
ncbi:hypothetical protein FRC07_008619, partial [Ceratobasidium sp. 392]